MRILAFLLRVMGVWCWNRARFCFFVRVCRRKMELLTLINEAVNATCDQEDFARRVYQFVLDPHQENSVYGSTTSDPFDPCHALAVIASSIGQHNFVQHRKISPNNCARCTLILPADELRPYCRWRFTPNANTHFSPADFLHYDLSVTDVQGFAAWLFESLRARRVRWVALSKENDSFILMARLVYSWCVGRYGQLGPDALTTERGAAKKLSPQEQIEVLRFLASPDDCFS
ncbi:MAG: hypothetical protein KatS3mg110_4075 [Pirellulaceae bacterium]|nr:MAG: hypothetical protein KatS3mg110_4075 [Pirellulaceae bacterium]